MAQLADLIDICGLGNRASHHSRNLIERFFEKSVESGSFFRDLRMTLRYFDEVVALTVPHLPRGRRGPAALPPSWRVFAVLFWCARRGRQRVVARAVDVAESTFCKFVAPVVRAFCLCLPVPAWPGQNERRQITLDFSRMTEGHLVGRKGLCAFCSLFGRRE